MDDVRVVCLAMALEHYSGGPPEEMVSIAKVFEEYLSYSDFPPVGEIAADETGYAQ
jgi:hypothetical protein